MTKKYRLIEVITSAPIKANRMFLNVKLILAPCNASIKRAFEYSAILKDTELKSIQDDGYIFADIKKIELARRKRNEI